MGSLLPLSITTNCTMKSLLIFSTLLAVGLSEPEAKAIVAPYNYGIQGYYGGAAAPFAYNNAWTAPLNYAPQTAYPYAPQTAYSYAPYAQAYAPIAAPAPLSSQFAAGDEFGNTQHGYSNWASSKHEVGNGFGQKTGSYQYVDPNGELQTVTYVADEFGFRTEDSRLPVAPVHEYELPVAPVHEYILPVAPVHEYILPVAPEKTPEVIAAEAEH